MPRELFSVSSLTANIKQILEEKYPIIWISGEISNLRIPSSGHAYFTLKDVRAQISAVIFKGQLRQIGFDLQDGTTIVGMGRISVYEPRGTYQIIFEYIEPHGLGALQLAFEQLKRKLEKEGLFDSRHKRPLPVLPKKIGVITSSSGSVIRDILTVSRRRFANLDISIFPVRVQGSSAPMEIIKAINNANQHCQDLDLLILARGGGSLEDLAAFNDESVARAIFDSRIPVISAVGHETDFSIADFVADYRAPTPSAAAEIAVPVKSELLARCMELKMRCLRAAQAKVLQCRRYFEDVNTRLMRPRRGIQEQLLLLDDLEQRLQAAMKRFIGGLKLVHLNQSKYLYKINIKDYMIKYKSKNEIIRYKLLQSMKIYLGQQAKALSRLRATLEALSPLAVLSRGYSITRTLDNQHIVMNAKETSIGQRLEVLFANSAIQVKVEKNN